MTFNPFIKFSGYFLVMLMVLEELIHPLVEDMEHSDPVLKGMVMPLEDMGLLHPVLVDMGPYFVACFLIQEALGMEVVPNPSSLLGLEVAADSCQYWYIFAVGAYNLVVEEGRVAVDNWVVLDNSLDML